MIHRMLIDECLSRRLVPIACARGHYATHVTYLGRAGTADWNIIPLLGAEDFVFVTNDARDFVKLFSRLELHAGLIILLPQTGIPGQIAMFEQALEVAESTDMVNRLIEVRLDGRMSVRDWPAADG